MQEIKKNTGIAPGIFFLYIFAIDKQSQDKYRIIFYDMDKSEAIKELIKEVNQKKALVFHNGYIQDSKYDKIHIWKEFRVYFEMLDNVETFKSIGSIGNEYNIFDEYNIFPAIAKIKNLKNLMFYSNDLGYLEKYINKGLINFPKLEKLWLVNAQFKEFPTVLYQKTEEKPIEFILPNLKKLSLLGNNFYSKNFHIKIKENKRAVYSYVNAFIDEKYGNDIEKLQSIIKNSTPNALKLHLEKLDELFLLLPTPWGFTNQSKNILIFKDDFINESINSISVYVLEDKDRFITFKTYYNFFKELNEQIDCFETNEKGELKVFFYYQNEFIDEIELETLKQLQKNNVKKYKGKFINDLLIYLGGEELITEIEKEHAIEDIDLSKSFYEKNKWIKSISVENFKLFDKFALDNLDDINIIVGKNGTGKTSLLQAIAASLLPHNSDDIDVYSKFINIQLKDKTSTSRYARTYVKWEEFEKSQRIFIDEIQLENENELPQSYLVLAYGENLYAEKHPFKDDEDLSYQDVLAKGFYKSYHTSSIFSTTYNKMPNPLDLLNSLTEKELAVKYLPLKQEFNQLHKIIFEKLNKLLAISSAKKIEIVKEGDSYKFKDNNIIVDFDQISEGYRSYIILLTDIILRILAARNKLLVNGYKIDEIFDKVKGTIIIDEFDKHMHPSWQRTFLKTLKTEFPNIQFFLSTHNIVSLQSAEGKKIFVLNDRGEIENADEKIPLGWSIEALYSHYFDEYFFSDEITQKIKELKLRRDKMLKSRNFADLESPDFKKITDELSKISSQTAMIVNIELNQLYQLKNNAKTK